jgi:hypothetical protein
MVWKVFHYLKSLVHTSRVYILSFVFFKKNMWIQGEKSLPQWKKLLIVSTLLCNDFMNTCTTNFSSNFWLSYCQTKTVPQTICSFAKARWSVGTFWPECRLCCDLGNSNRGDYDYEYGLSSLDVIRSPISNILQFFYGCPKVVYIHLNCF